MSCAEKVWAFNAIAAAAVLGVIAIDVFLDILPRIQARFKKENPK